MQDGRSRPEKGVGVWLPRGITVLSLMDNSFKKESNMMNGRLFIAGGSYFISCAL